MKSQTFTDFEWIVVDDGDRPITPTMGQIYVRRKPSKKSFTLDRNFTAGAKLISCDAVTLLEDDDWRGPNYLAGMMEALKSVDVSVTAGFYTYNVKYKLWEDRREQHEKLYRKTSPLVSLHAGFSGEAAKHFVEKMHTGLKARPFWTYVWKRFEVKLFDADMVAIKGIAGRSWRGNRHKGGLFPRKNVDPEGKLLAKLVGREDARLLLRAGRR
jgi:glycosyltransferase involved in cell wall biosynthesis